MSRTVCTLCESEPVYKRDLSRVSTLGAHPYVCSNLGCPYSTAVNARWGFTKVVDGHPAAAPSISASTASASSR